MINDAKLETSTFKNNCTADVGYINFVVNDLFVQTISVTACTASPFFGEADCGAVKSYSIVSI